MADKNFPGPSYNRIIEEDPQIVKVPMNSMGWASRMSIFGELKGDARGNNASPPNAPEMTIKHVG